MHALESSARQNDFGAHKLFARFNNFHSSACCMVAAQNPRYRFPLPWPRVACHPRKEWPRPVLFPAAITSWLAGYGTPWVDYLQIRRLHDPDSVAAASKSFKKRTRPRPKYFAIAAPSTTHGIFVGCTRFCTTGPAIPKDAAVTLPLFAQEPRDGSFKALVFMGRVTFASNRCELSARISNRPRLTFVPPRSPARIIQGPPP